MTISLTVSREAGAGETGTYAHVFDKDEVLFGRDVAVDVVLPHPTVSLVHLRLRQKGGALLIQDLDSTNGTALCGRRLAPQEEVSVNPGDLIVVGPFEILVGPGDRPGASPPRDTSGYARQTVLEIIGALDGQPGLRGLEIENGAQKGQRLDIPPLSAPLAIGRGERCDLQLSDADASRRHVEVRLQGDEVTLRDLGSKNGFEISGRRVTGSATLRHHDTILVGQTRLMFTDPAGQYLLAMQEDSPLDCLPPELAGGPGAATGKGALAAGASGRRSPADRSDAVRSAAAEATLAWRTRDRLVFVATIVLVLGAAAAIIYLVV